MVLAHYQTDLFPAYRRSVLRALATSPLVSGMPHMDVSILELMPGFQHFQVTECVTAL